MTKAEAQFFWDARSNGLFQRKVLNEHGPYWVVVSYDRTVPVRICVWSELGIRLEDWCDWTQETQAQFLRMAEEEWLAI